MKKNEKDLHNKIKDTHNSDWHKYAGISSGLSILLPIISEFEGAIADNFIMGVGGAGAVSVFAVLMKVGRVASIIPEIEEEHHEHLKEEADNHRKIIVDKRQRRIDSDYLPDL